MPSLIERYAASQCWVVSQQITKKPLTIYGAGASVTNPATWCRLDQVPPGERPAIVINQNMTPGLWCIDLDHSLIDGEWSDLAKMILSRFPGAYVEVSQSGEGLHIFGYASAIPNHGKKKTTPFGTIEMYSADRAMALGFHETATGDPWAYDYSQALSTVAQLFLPPNEYDFYDEDDVRAEWDGPTDDTELLSMAMRSKGSAKVQLGNAASFAMLFGGDPEQLSKFYPTDNPHKDFDHSQADMALANMLAFWTGCDVERMEALMWQSGLVREKWKTHTTYLRKMTIGKAAAECREVYNRSRYSQTEPEQQQQQPQSVGSDLITYAAGGLQVSLKNPGKLATTRDNLIKVLSDPKLCGHDIYQDTFLGKTIMDAQPMCKADVDRLMAGKIEAMFDKEISPEKFKACLAVAANDRSIDGLQFFINNTLPTWDGVPRVQHFYNTYCGAEDSPYSQALGLYTFTALIDRALNPGCKCDMTPIWVSAEGVRKSTGIAALSPDPEWMSLIDLGKRDEELIRKMRGKVILEFAEMRGLNFRDTESIKAFMTTQADDMRELYDTVVGRNPRRCLFIGSSNDYGIIGRSDIGLRRWCPIETPAVDVESIRRDCLQLWAEALAWFKQYGQMWQLCQQLAAQEMNKFVDGDEWEDAIRDYLDRTGWMPELEVRHVAFAVFGMTITTMRMGDSRRIARCLMRLGYSLHRSKNKRTYKLKMGDTN